MSAIQELIDSKGRPISQRDVFVAMRVNTLAACLGSIWLAMTFTMPLVMFMQAIGASGAIIGLVSTVRLLAVSAQIPAAIIADKLGSRKPVWSPFAFGQRLAWFGVAAMAFWCVPAKWWLATVLLVIIGASEFSGNAATAPWLSWMADLIPLPISGRFWGIRQSVATAASLLGLAAAGQILDATRNPLTGQAQPSGFAIVFAIAAFAGTADIIVHQFIREPQSAPAHLGGTLYRRILAPFLSPDFRFLTLSLGAWNFGLAMTTSFAFIYLKRDFGVTYSQLAALGIATSLGAVFTSFGFGEIMDRIGTRRLGAILLSATPLSLLPWLLINHSTVSAGPFSFPQSIVLISGAGILGGSLSSAIIVCQLRLASELSKPRGRTMFMAVHYAFVGLLGALGPTAGGLLMDYFPARLGALVIPSGIPFSFYHAQLILFCLLLWLVAVPLLLAIRPSMSRSP